MHRKNVKKVYLDMRFIILVWQSINRLMNLFYMAIYNNAVENTVVLSHYKLDTLIQSDIRFPPYSYYIICIIYFVCLFDYNDT